MRLYHIVMIVMGTNSAIFMVFPANSLFGIMFFFVANATEFRKAVEEEVYKHLK